MECIESFNKGEIDTDTLFKIEKQILVDEFDNEEFLNFAIEHYSEMFPYIATGKEAHYLRYVHLFHNS